jgi:hypothetical protein
MSLTEQDERKLLKNNDFTSVINSSFYKYLSKKDQLKAIDNLSKLNVTNGTETFFKYLSIEEKEISKPNIQPANAVTQRSISCDSKLSNATYTVDYEDMNVPECEKSLGTDGEDILSFTDEEENECSEKSDQQVRSNSSENIKSDKTSNVLSAILIFTEENGDKNLIRNNSLRLNSSQTKIVQYMKLDDLSTDKNEAEGMCLSAADSEVGDQLSFMGEDESWVILDKDLKPNFDKRSSNNLIKSLPNETVESKKLNETDAYKNMDSNIKVDQNKAYRNSGKCKPIINSGNSYKFGSNEEKEKLNSAKDKARRQSIVVKVEKDISLTEDNENSKKFDETILSNCNSHTKSVKSSQINKAVQPCQAVSTENNQINRQSYNSLKNITNERNFDSNKMLGYSNSPETSNQNYICCGTSSQTKIYSQQCHDVLKEDNKSAGVLKQKAVLFKRSSAESNQHRSLINTNIVTDDKGVLTNVEIDQKPSKKDVQTESGQNKGESKIENTESKVLVTTVKRNEIRVPVFSAISLRNDLNTLRKRSSICEYDVNLHIISNSFESPVNVDIGVHKYVLIARSPWFKDSYIKFIKNKIPEYFNVAKDCTNSITIKKIETRCANILINLELQNVSYKIITQFGKFYKHALSNAKTENTIFFQ